MTTSVTAVGFDLQKDQSEMIEKKIGRVKYADDLIVDLIIRVKHEKAFVFEANVNFRWGAQCHVSGEDYDFGASLNKMMDVLDNKIEKEKEKVQSKK